MKYLELYKISCTCCCDSDHRKNLNIDHYRLYDIPNDAETCIASGNKPIYYGIFLGEVVDSTHWKPQKYYKFLISEFGIIWANSQFHLMEPILS